MRFRSLFYSVSLVALLTGCAVGPDFETPEAPKTSAYDSTPLPSQTVAANEDGTGVQKFLPGQDIPAEWWAVFHSEPLNHLIKQAIAGSPNLEAAQASLRVAQENTAAGEGVLFPTASVDFSTYREKTSGASAGGKFAGSLYTLHTASVSVSYGLDIFGGARRALEELNAEEDFQRYQLEAAYLTLTSNVVATAITEAALRGQIAATQAIIEDESKQLNIIQQQFDLGGIDRVPLLAQQAQVQQFRATLPGLQKQLAMAQHQMSVLLGRTPDQPAAASFDLANLNLPDALPVTLPSKLVEQRPDIRAAEANLHAASATIGVAEANRLPQITLSADLGSQANSLSTLFSKGSGIWSAGFDVAQTIFDAGILAHKQGAAEAEFDLAAAQYKQTVLTAFQNVADTLRALQADAETLSAQTAAEQAAAQSLNLAQLQYEAGSISYLNLLSAEQAEQQAKLTLVQAVAQRYADTAALFQSLGGGWWNRDLDITKTDNTHALAAQNPPPDGDKK